MCAYTYVHIYVCNNNKREDMNLKESKERYVGVFEERKGNKKYNYIIISKINKKIPRPPPLRAVAWATMNKYVMKRWKR